MNEPIRYMSAADIGDLFGVPGPTVEKWRQRYATFPAPDAVTGIGHDRPICGWLPARAGEFRAWKECTVRGPGRPRKDAAAEKRPEGIRGTS